MQRFAKNGHEQWTGWKEPEEEREWIQPQQRKRNNEINHKSLVGSLYSNNSKKFTVHTLILQKPKSKSKYSLELLIKLRTFR